MFKKVWVMIFLLGVFLTIICSNFLLAFLLGSKRFSNSTNIWKWNCMKMLQSSMWRKVWTCRHVYICLETLNWFSDPIPTKGSVQMQIVYSSISKPLQSPKQSTQKLFLCQYLKISRFILIILSEWWYISFGIVRSWRDHALSWNPRPLSLSQ